MKQKIEAQVADFHRRTASRKQRSGESVQQTKRVKKRKVQELAESRKRQEEARKSEKEWRLKVLL